MIEHRYQRLNFKNMFRKPPEALPSVAESAPPAKLASKPGKPSKTELERDRIDLISEQVQKELKKKQKEQAAESGKKHEKSEAPEKSRRDESKQIETKHESKPNQATTEKKPAGKAREPHEKSNRAIASFVFLALIYFMSIATHPQDSGNFHLQNSQLQSHAVDCPPGGIYKKVAPELAEALMAQSFVAVKTYIDAFVMTHPALERHGLTRLALQGGTAIGKIPDEAEGFYFKIDPDKENCGITLTVDDKHA